MQIGNETVAILKNFASINQSILIKKGSSLSTISNMKNIFANAEIQESLPVDFGIYDLNRFIGNLQFYPNLEWTKEYVTMSDGNKTYKYISSDPSTIIAPPDKKIKMPDPDLNFVLTNDTLKMVNKVASLNGLPDYALMSDGDDMYFVAMDKKDPSSDVAKEPVGKSNGLDFKVYFKSENMRLFEGDYDVEISNKNISRFVNKKKDLEYFIALESDSTFG